MLLAEAGYRRKPFLEFEEAGAGFSEERLEEEAEAEVEDWKNGVTSLRGLISFLILLTIGKNISSQKERIEEALLARISDITLSMKSVSPMPWR